jgi:transcriptional regulator with XRE-family HTH domain
VPFLREIAAELSRFGANIRRERTARNLTHERLDLDIWTLQKIEAGELDVLVSTAVRIQRALGCSWDKLMPPR